MPTILNLLLLVAAGLCAAFVANDFEPDAIARQRLQVALLGIAPPVPAFLLLRSRRARSASPTRPRAASSARSSSRCPPA